VSGIELIHSEAALAASPEFDRISIAMVLPTPHLSQDLLLDHLMQAMWHPATEFSVRQHAQNNTHKPFGCHCFYADDEDVTASCAAYEDTFVAMIGIQFVRRLVKICALLGPALRQRPRSPRRGATATSGLVRDPKFQRLIAGDELVSESEALAILADWPEAGAEGLQIELGEFALFYDLIRLVWLHEWAHALCGHTGFAHTSMGLTRLNEFSADRPGADLIAGVGHSRFEVLQSLEIHADEFAAHYCVRELLFGYDPVGQLAGPSVDLVDRLLFFNIACCLFAIIWEISERRYLPDQSYYPPRADLLSDEQPTFRMFESTHPPADLRYWRFRGFQRDNTIAWRGEGAAHLGSSVDAASTLMIDVLGAVCAEFFHLRDLTPLAAVTPRMRRLRAYEQHLLEVGLATRRFLDVYGFRPTVDPFKD
jgi:hypothetical protein